MTKDDVIRRLNDPEVNRAQVARETGLRYMYLCELAWGKVKDPGSARLDRLRSYFISQDVSRARVTGIGT